MVESETTVDFPHFSIRDLSKFFEIVFLTSEDGFIHYANQNGQRLLLCPVAQASSFHLQRCFARKQENPTLEEIVARAKSVEGWKGEILFSFRKEMPFWIHCHHLAGWGQREGLFLWIGIDVEQAMAEEALLKAEELTRYWIELQEMEHERFRMVVEGAPHAMVIVDFDRIITLVNGQAEKLFGYRREELLGESVDKVIPESLRVKYKNRMEEYFEHPLTSSNGLYEKLLLHHKNGSEIPVEIGLTPLKMKEGRFLLASMIDISEREKIEQMKREFVSTVSHELRTPLTSIRGSLGLLVEGVAGEISEEAKGFMKIALDSCERLVRLINDILDIEKIECGKMDLHQSLQPIVPLIEEAIRLNRSYADQFAVELYFERPHWNVDLIVDIDRIHQLLSNLIANGVKFSPKGERVTIFLELLDGYVRVSIADKGNGITEEFKSKIFQKFSQQDSSDSRTKGGTGLGLSIAKAIVELHGGEIGFHSIPNKGTTFFFTLPLP